MASPWIETLKLCSAAITEYGFRGQWREATGILAVTRRVQAEGWVSLVVPFDFEDHLKYLKWTQKTKTIKYDQICTVMVSVLNGPGLKNKNQLFEMSVAMLRSEKASGRSRRRHRFGSTATRFYSEGSSGSSTFHKKNTRYSKIQQIQKKIRNPPMLCPFFLVVVSFFIWKKGFCYCSKTLRLYRKAINSCRENGQWKSCAEILRFLRHLQGKGLSRFCCPFFVGENTLWWFFSLIFVYGLFMLVPRFWPKFIESCFFSINKKGIFNLFSPNSWPNLRVFDG